MPPPQRGAPELTVLPKIAAVFTDFDFSLLDDPAFKEDSVREELIVPILKRLGYSASPPNQISRSTALEHPYVYIGSQKKKISIFPDYILSRNEERFLVLDAKGPNENILEGKNVEQAYSYAIHKDVRTEWFALCNGREFALFHVSHWPTVLHFPLDSIEDHWNDLAKLVGIDSVQRDATFYPDLGIGMLRLGFGAKESGEKVHQLFSILSIDLAARVDDDTYSMQSHIEFDGSIFLGTFDFAKEQVNSFIEAILPEERREGISAAIRSNPFIWKRSDGNEAFVAVSCNVADHVITNDKESYLPFEVDKFI